MKKGKLLLNILIIVVAIFFAYKLYDFLHTKADQKESIQIYSSLKDLKPVKEEAVVKVDEDIEEDEDDDFDIDFGQLKLVNEDIIAWISDGGSIDYPIVQGKDNYKYLYTAATGKRNVAGAIFMDYRNQNIADPLVLIYGHEMDNKTMFGTLHEFKREPEHLDFTFTTEEGVFESKAVVAGIISGETYINPKDYDSFEKLQRFYKLIKDNAVYDSGYELEEDDKIIALITCTYERKNVRLVVLTVYKEKDEDGKSKEIQVEDDM